MKQLAFLLMIHSTTYAQNTINNLRELLYASYNSEVAADQLYNATEQVTLKSPAVLLGYKGMAEMMRCRYVISPIEKILCFNRGKKFLEVAIEKEYYNTELRYLRFTVQENAPAFLGYRKNIEADKKVLFHYLDKKELHNAQDTVLYNNIRAYLLQSDYCTGKEKKLLSTN